MSSAQEYYDSLVAQGYAPEQAKAFTQQHFPTFMHESVQESATTVQDTAVGGNVHTGNIVYNYYNTPPPPVAEPKPAAPQPMAAPMAAAMPAPMPASMPTAPQPMAAPMTAPPMGQPMAAPMGAPMGGMMPASPGDAPGVLNWVALGLTAVAITMVFIAMFSNSWMTTEEGDETLDFGFYEYEGDGYSNFYDDCDADECPDMDSAGLTGMIFLWIAVAAAIGSLVLMCLNNFNVYNSKFGMIACFVSGGLAIAGAIIWLIMFPEVDELEPMYVSTSFYMAIIAGVCSVGSGVCELKS